MLAMSNMINAAAGSVNTLFVAGNTSTFASENEALAVIKAAIGEIKEDWSVLPFAEEEGCNFDQAADFIAAYNRVIGDVNIASAFRIVSFATWRTDYVNSYIF